MKASVSGLGVIESILARLEVIERRLDERDTNVGGLITVREWSKRNSVAEPTAWRWVREGHLPSKKLGRCRRVPANAEPLPTSSGETVFERAEQRLGLKASRTR